MRHLKLFPATLLAASLALPISTCSSYENSAGESVVLGVGESPPPGAEVTTRPNFPITSWSEAHWSLAWLWPVLLRIYDFLAHPRGLGSAGWFLEPPLLLASAVVIALQAVPGDLAIGGFLAYASLLALAAVWLAEATSWLHARWHAA